MSRHRESAAAVAFAMAFGVSGPAVAQEVVDHPAYVSWSKRPVGTSVTIRSVTETPRSKLETTTKTTLLELKPEKAVLQVRRTSDATGTKVTAPAETYEQGRMFPLLGATKKEDVGKPTGAIAKGEETLTVAGKAVKAVWFDSKTKGDGGSDVLTRTWMSEDVPGRLVKSVSRMPQAGTTVTVEVVELAVP